MLKRAVPRWTRADRIEWAAVVMTLGGFVAALSFFAGIGLSMYLWWQP